MTDFRDRLYERYYSSHHKERSDARRARLTKYFRWLDRKLGPFLSDLPRDARILELGCGTGEILEYLKARGFSNAKGIDRCAEHVEIARSHGVEAEIADVSEHLRQEAGKPDAVIAFDLIEHFTVDELLDLFDLLRTWIRPGGRLILQTPNAEGLFAPHVVHGDLTHSTAFTPLSLRHLLNVTGFTNPRFIECGPAAISIPGAVRVVLWRAVCGMANLVRMVELGGRQEMWTANMICVAQAPGSEP